MDSDLLVLASFGFIVYTMVMIVTVLQMWDRHRYKYPRQGLKVKHIIVFIVAPHSTIFSLLLISVGLLLTMVISSKPYKKVINFINKDLF